MFNINRLVNYEFLKISIASNVWIRHAYSCLCLNLICSLKVKWQWITLNGHSIYITWTNSIIRSLHWVHYTIVIYSYHVNNYCIYNVYWPMWISNVTFYVHYSFITCWSARNFCSSHLFTKSWVWRLSHAPFWNQIVCDETAPVFFCVYWICKWHHQHVSSSSVNTSELTDIILSQ